MWARTDNIAAASMAYPLLNYMLSVHWTRSFTIRSKYDVHRLCVSGVIRESFLKELYLLTHDR